MKREVPSVLREVAKTNHILEALLIRYDTVEEYSYDMLMLEAVVFLDKEIECLKCVNKATLDALKYELRFPDSQSN